MSRISIIVPVYKVEPYLHKCVDSILAQTYENLEIILVDDGSPDNCGAICDEYARRDKRIKVIHKENGGLSDARNAGLDIAKGDYVGFVDSDDYIESDMYEMLLHNLQKAEADISICEFTCVFPKKMTFQSSNNEILIFNNAEGMKRLIKDDEINSYYWNKLYKKKLFKDLRLPVGKVYEDIFTQHFLFAKAKAIVFQKTPKYYYVMSAQSILRGGFRSNHLDGLEATGKRIAFAKSNYPQLVPIAKEVHIRRALHLLVEIALDDFRRYSREFDRAYQELDNTWKSEGDKGCFNRKELFWIKLALLNKSWFPLFYRSYMWIYKGLWNFYRYWFSVKNCMKVEHIRS